MSQVICAWCQVVMGAVESKGTSHGICTTCLVKVRQEAGLPSKESK